MPPSDPGQKSRPAERRGLCLVISAPSGAGKSTIANALRAAEPELMHSVSVTTRQPRPGEKEGVHYLFRSPEQFAAMAEAGELLEWATVFGRGYGTPRAARSRTGASSTTSSSTRCWSAPSATRMRC